jgi:hypothetical protein
VISTRFSKKSDFNYSFAENLNCMYNTNEIEVFSSSLELVVNTLKHQNKLLVESCGKMLALLLGSERSLNVFTSAILELSKVSPQDFHWALESFSDFKAFSQLAFTDNTPNIPKEIRYKMNYTKIFSSTVELIIQALKLKNKNILESYENSLNCIFGHEYTAQIFLGALFELSEIDPESFAWASQNLFHIEYYSRLFRLVTMCVAQRLIEKGFIPGEDFSANCMGQILIHEKVKRAFLSSTSDPDDRMLFQQILQGA